MAFQFSLDVGSSNAKNVDDHLQDFWRILTTTSKNVEDHLSILALLPNTWWDKPNMEITASWLSTYKRKHLSVIAT